MLQGGWDERRGVSLGKHWYRRWDPLIPPFLEHLLCARPCAGRVFSLRISQSSEESKQTGGECNAEGCSCQGETCFPSTWRMPPGVTSSSFVPLHPLFSREVVQWLWIGFNKGNEHVSHRRCLLPPSGNQMPAGSPLSISGSMFYGSQRCSHVGSHMGSKAPMT